MRLITIAAARRPTIDAGHMMSSNDPMPKPAGVSSTTIDATAAETGEQMMPTCDATADTARGRSGRIFA